MMQLYHTLDVIYVTCQMAVQCTALLITPALFDDNVWEKKQEFPE